MNVQSVPRYIPAIVMDRATGELRQTQVNWTELMEKAKANRDTFQSGGRYGTTVDPSKPGGLIEVLPSGELQAHSPITEKAGDEKPNVKLDSKDQKEDFWEARMRRQKEYQALQAEAAARRRILQKLQSGEPVSAAELLLGL